MIDAEFWYDKRVFVTGHTGFKGSWLCLWLQKMGAVVKGYALAPPGVPSIFKEANVEQGMESVLEDICDQDALYQSVSEFRPDIVIHMAAQALVRHSYASPVETYATNVMGTVHLLEAVRKAGGVKAVINVTSDKCYENKEWPWGYREDEPKGGYDPYSNSKGCAELVADAYRSSFFNAKDYSKHGCGLASVRAGNVIGGGDWAEDRLVPDMIKAFQSGETALIRNPYAIRPWQHVLEPLSGYLLTAQKLYEKGPEYAEGWNFGPDDSDAMQVQSIADSLVRIWGEDARWELDGIDHPHEASYLKLDCSKAKMRMGWKPRWALDETLRRIVDWYKAWLRQENMRAYCLSEIDQYIATDYTNGRRL